MFEAKSGPHVIGARILGGLVLTLLVSVQTYAQMFSYGGSEHRAVQSLAFTTQFIDFAYDGSGSPTNRLDFNGPAYGVSYNRPNFSATIVWGSNPRSVSQIEDNPVFINDDISLIDATLQFWGNIFRLGQGSSRFSFPIVIHSGYRSVSGSLSTGPNDSFSYSLLGIGGGLAFASEPAGKIHIEARAWPVINMAFRSFQGFSGSSFLVDSDILVNIPDIFGSIGLGLGYGYRYQDWNTDDSSLINGFSRDTFDYKSNQHMVRIGISW